MNSILSFAEASSGIVVACAPTLGPVLFPNRFGPLARDKQLSTPKTFGGKTESGRTPPRATVADAFEERSFYRLDSANTMELEHLPDESMPDLPTAATIQAAPREDFCHDAEICMRKDIHVYSTRGDAPKPLAQSRERAGVSPYRSTFGSEQSRTI